MSNWNSTAIPSAFSFGRFFFVLLSTVLFFSMEAQIPSSPGGPGQARGDRPMPTGRFYGKVVDDSGQGLGYATVQLIRTQNNPQTGINEEMLVTGQITSDNGDFSLENVPVFEQYTLKVSFIGFSEISMPLSFNDEKSSGGAPSGSPQGGQFRGMAPGGFDKDIGNIKLALESETLSEVTVTAEKAAFALAIDKREYRVDKDASVAGGDAVDALRNIPSLSVDLDGNVRLRNGAPQIFVDGRPTTLSLDQISADIIETVEVITNPSARYDAGGGSAGIINIVLKKDKRLGYNGNVRAGTDTNGSLNLGGSINARSDKTNIFLSTFLNNRRGQSTGETFQQNLVGNPPTYISQYSDSDRNGYFGNIRGGVDWFMDNRNTLTFSANYTRGVFDPSEVLSTRTDSLFSGYTTSSLFERISEQERSFRNIGGSVLFKHLFPKQGAEWTADINFNRVKFNGMSDYTTLFESGGEEMEFQQNLGTGQFITIQTDYVNPISDQIKLEGGLRAAMRTNSSDNSNSFFNVQTQQWEEIYRLTDEYRFTDNVFAAYGIMNHDLGKWAYQVGLRAESSFYTGNIVENEESFEINYPINLFPSVFVTHEFNTNNNLQFSYTRRINRPHFFQTLPFTDISNALNPRRGNIQLRPEFSNSFELSFQKVFNQGHNVLVSTYFKEADDLITTILVDEFVPELGENALVSTYANSNSSSALGGEITVKNSITKSVDLTSNVNLYHSRVDASNVENDLIIDRFTWFVKENLSVKLPAGFTLQVTGEYRSKASFTPNDGQQRGWGPPTSNSAQGYQLANWFVDAALRKDLLNRKLTVTLNVNDIFRSRKMGSYTESDFFIQESYRFRQPQVVRLNVSYNFGKRDATLFKRKNNNQNAQGSDMM